MVGIHVSLWVRYECTNTQYMYMCRYNILYVTKVTLTLHVPWPYIENSVPYKFYAFYSCVSVKINPFIWVTPHSLNLFPYMYPLKFIQQNSANIHDPQIIKYMKVYSCSMYCVCVYLTTVTGSLSMQVPLPVVYPSCLQIVVLMGTDRPLPISLAAAGQQRGLDTPSRYNSTVWCPWRVCSPERQTSPL